MMKGFKRYEFTCWQRSLLYCTSFLLKENIHQDKDYKNDRIVVLGKLKKSWNNANNNNNANNYNNNKKNYSPVVNQNWHQIFASML